MMRKIVLASQSPRRKQLLEWAEIEFDILSRETGETWPEGLAMEEIPVYISREKALAVRAMDLFKRYEGDIPVLAADTIVVLDDKVLGKPLDREHAIAMLKDLSGRKHKVVTGVVIMSDEKEISFSDVTEVEFHPIAEEDLIYYVDTYQPFDKAGAYAIQEWIGVVGIKSVIGDFYNVMGLPVSRVVQSLYQNF
ncbi:MAG TPA: Maf family nucleotide pyrophosphatase [Chitinophagaceae bacterium]|nr:Maf family nucleotide pyrophosphatase [Chitinophagaceae bacterium]